MKECQDTVAFPDFPPNVRGSGFPERGGDGLSGIIVNPLYTCIVAHSRSSVDEIKSSIHDLLWLFSQAPIV